MESFRPLAKNRQFLSIWMPKRPFALPKIRPSKRLKIKKRAIKLNEIFKKSLNKGEVMKTKLFGLFWGISFFTLTLAQSVSIENIQVNPNGHDGNEPCFIITCDVTVNGMLNQNILFQCYIFTYKNEAWVEVENGYQQLTSNASYDPSVWTSFSFALRKAFFLEKLGQEEQTLCAVISVHKAEDGSTIHQESSETFLWNQEIWGGQTPAPEELSRKENTPSKTVEEVSWQSFTSPDNSFSLNYPQHWSSQMIEEGKNYLFEEKEAGAGFRVQVKALNDSIKNLPLLSFVNTTKKNWKDAQFQILQDFQLNLGTIPGTGFLAEGKIEELPGISKVGTLVAKNEGFLFLLFFWAPQQKWDSYNPLYLQIIQSFQSEPALKKENTTSNENCTVCKGQGIQSCGNNCLGNLLNCDFCGGSGQNTDGYSCTWCSGSGTKLCNRCGGDGWETCKKCFGSGRQSNSQAPDTNNSSSSLESPKDNVQNNPNDNSQNTANNSVQEVLVFKTTTKTIKSFGFSLEIPESWREKRETPLFFTFETKRVLSNALTVSHPVFCQFIYTKPENSQEFLNQSLRAGLEKISDYSISKDTHFKAYESKKWQLPSGENGVTLAFEVLRGSTAVGGCYILLYILSRGDYSLMIGTVAGFSKEINSRQDNERQKIQKDFFQFANEEVLCAISRSQINFPPINESWAQWLINKKSYFYEYESSSSFSTSEGPLSTGNHNVIQWTFYPDRTCDFKGTDFFGMTGSTYNDQSHSDLSSIFAGDEKGNKSFSKRRFEVRGTNETDLWIMVYHQNNITTLHQIEPKKKLDKFWTNDEVEGFAIDEKIEGYYEVANGTGVWRKTKP